MSITYRVTSRPTFGLGGENDSDFFAIGDVFTVGDDDYDAGPDSDGDFYVLGSSDEPDVRHYVHKSCVTPMAAVAPTNDVERVSVKAVRALLTLSGSPASDTDEFIRRITILDTALLS